MKPNALIALAARRLRSICLPESFRSHFVGDKQEIRYLFVLLADFLREDLFIPSYHSIKFDLRSICERLCIS
jgi:hypothetical protein